jgi:hypothetical protein
MLSADKIKFPTVGALQADTVMSYAPGAGKTQVGEGDIVEAERFPYTVDDAAAAGDQQTAAGIKLNVLRLTTGEFSLDQFSGAGIGAKFNKAIAAIQERRENTANTWFPDTTSLIIPPGTYDLDETLVLSLVSNLKIDFSGAVIRNLDSALTPFKLVGSAKNKIINLSLDLRNNNLPDQAVLFAGSSGWNTFEDLRVQANTTNAGFACVRMLQGDVNGPDDGNRDKGNFWNTFDRFWCRKLMGADAGNIPTVFDLQGCQNATKIINSGFNNFGNGVVVRNQNGSSASGISNALVVDICDFEGWTNSAFKFVTEGGIAPIALAGGVASNCRFESGGTIIDTSAMSISPTIPFMVSLPHVVSSVTTFHNGNNTNVSLLYSGWTPALARSRIGGAAGIFVSNTSNPGASALGVFAKQPQSGGAISIERADGTVDGLISQRPGGGLQIKGGGNASNAPLEIGGITGLSGTPTFAKNFRGFTTLTSGTTFDVVFGTPETDTVYRILYGCEDNRRLWTTNRTVNGFTINSDVPFAGAAIAWMLIR